MSTVTTASSGVRTPADLLAVARRYAARRDDWPFAPRFDPVRRWYRRLATEPDIGVEVWILTWLPGQGTDLHNHGGSSGAFLTVSGTLTEHTVDSWRDVPRLVDGSLEAGEGRAFGPRHIHQVVNTGREPAVSLHAYSPALREMTRYRIEDGRLIVTAVDLAGVDW